MGILTLDKEKYSKCGEDMIVDGGVTRHRYDKVCPKCNGVEIEETTMGYRDGINPNEQTCLGCGHRWYLPEFLQRKSDFRRGLVEGMDN